MLPSRPYLFKALYEWMLDSALTPYLLVNAEEDDVIVPTQFVDEGQVVLNISPSALKNFYMDDEAISFNARFSGKPMDIYIPMLAIMAIYARENGEGMSFGGEPGAQCYFEEADEGLAEVDLGVSESSDSVAEPNTEQEPKPKRKGPNLKVIK